MKRIFFLCLGLLVGCEEAFFFSGGAMEVNLSFTVCHSGETIAALSNCSSAGMDLEIPLESLKVTIRQGGSYLKKNKPFFGIETASVPQGGRLILHADLSAYGYRMEDLKTGALYSVLLEYSSKALGGWNGTIIGEGELSLGAANRKMAKALNPPFIYYTVFGDDDFLVESKEFTGEGWRLLSYPLGGF